MLRFRALRHHPAMDVTGRMRLGPFKLSDGPNRVFHNGYSTHSIPVGSPFYSRTLAAGALVSSSAARVRSGSRSPYRHIVQLGHRLAVAAGGAVAVEGARAR